MKKAVVIPEGGRDEPGHYWIVDFDSELPMDAKEGDTGYSRESKKLHVFTGVKWEKL